MHADQPYAPRRVNLEHPLPSTRCYDACITQHTMPTASKPLQKSHITHTGLTVLQRKGQLCSQQWGVQG